MTKGEEKRQRKGVLNSWNILAQQFKKKRACDNRVASGRKKCDKDTKTKKDETGRISNKFDKQET